jgi:ABC-type transporter Mla subunit MlaD
MSASVIPFPHRDPNFRLRTALSVLEAALDEQRAAIATWRESLTELRDTVGGVGHNLTALQSNLDRLKRDTLSLNDDAKAMESWADNVLAREVAHKA